MRNSVIIMVTLFTFLTGAAMAQKGEPKKQTVFIQTNAQCGDCKERMEEVLNFKKGVIYADLHLDNKKLEVRYHTKRISLEEIKKIISEIGYSADEVEPVKTAQEKLPACCQPGGHDD